RRGRRLRVVLADDEVDARDVQRYELRAREEGGQRPGLGRLGGPVLDAGRGVVLRAGGGGRGDRVVVGPELVRGLAGQPVGGGAVVDGDLDAGAVHGGRRGRGGGDLAGGVDAVQGAVGPQGGEEVVRVGVDEVYPRARVAPGRGDELD